MIFGFPLPWFLFITFVAAGILYYVRKFSRLRGDGADSETSTRGINTGGF